MYKKLLVAVDGSEVALKAVENAKALATATGGELLLLHVNNSAPESAQHKRIGIVADVPHTENLELVNEVLEIMAGSPVKFKLLTAVGHPATEILHSAEEYGCDTIVMGSRGLGSITKLFLGSVSSEVINKSELPVVIVK